MPIIWEVEIYPGAWASALMQPIYKRGGKDRHHVSSNDNVSSNSSSIAGVPFAVIRLGVCGPPYYCTPLVCVPAVIGVLAVWQYTKNQKTHLTSRGILTPLVLFLKNSEFPMPTPEERLPWGVLKEEFGRIIFQKNLTWGTVLVFCHGQSSRHLLVEVRRQNVRWPVYIMYILGKTRSFGQRLYAGESEAELQ